MMTRPALDTGSTRLAIAGDLWVDHLATSDELRFAVLDDEHVVGVVVHLRPASHDALGDDDQTFIFEDALTFDEAGRHLDVVYGVDARRKPGGTCHSDEGRSRNYRGGCEQIFHERSPYAL